MSGGSRRVGAQAPKARAAAIEAGEFLRRGIGGVDGRARRRERKKENRPGRAARFRSGGDEGLTERRWRVGRRMQARRNPRREALGRRGNRGVRQDPRRKGPRREIRSGKALREERDRAADVVMRRRDGGFQRGRIGMLARAVREPRRLVEPGMRIGKLG